MPFRKSYSALWEPHDLWAEEIVKLDSLGFALTTGAGLNRPDIEGLGFDAKLYEKVHAEDLAGEVAEDYTERDDEDHWTDPTEDERETGFEGNVEVEDNKNQSLWISEAVRTWVPTTARMYHDVGSCQCLSL